MFATGINIPRNDLVLSIDAGNIRCFRGEATENMLINGVNFSLWDKTSDTGSIPTVVENTSTSPYGKLNADTITIPDNGSNPRIYQNWTPILNQIHTFSVWLKSSQVNCAVRIMIVKNSPFTVIDNMLVEIGQEWKLCELPVYINNTDQHHVYIGSYGDTNAMEFQIWGAHLEFNASSYSTHYVDGYRGESVIDGGGFVDLSGNGNHGNCEHGLRFEPSFKGCLTFVENTSIPILNNPLNNRLYTKIAWFCVRDFSMANNIVSGSGTAEHFFGLGNDITKLRAGHNGVWNRVEGTTVLEQNVWYLGAVTFNSDGNVGWKLYLNGILEDSDSNVDFFGGSGEIFVGSYGLFANSFNGNIGNVWVYNRELSGGEILTIYNATKNRYIGSFPW